MVTRGGGPGSWRRKPPRERTTVSGPSHGGHGAPCCSPSSPLCSGSHKTNGLHSPLQTSLPQLHLVPTSLPSAPETTSLAVPVRTEPPGPLIRATARLPDYRTGGGECVQTREETLAAPLGPNSRPQHHAQCGVMTVLSKDTASSIIYGNARTPNLLLTDPHSFHAPNYAITPPAILDTIRKTHFLFLSLSPLLMTSAFSPLDRPETLPDGAAARAPPTCPTS